MNVPSGVGELAIPVFAGVRSATTDAPKKPPLGTREVRFALRGDTEAVLWLPESAGEPEWEMIDQYMRARIKLHATPEK